MSGVFFAQFERPLYPGDEGVALGYFSSLEEARRHVAGSKTKPGFADAPSRFAVEFWALDVVQWTSGFLESTTLHGPDVPHWAKRRLPIGREPGKVYARRLCDERFGPGRYHYGPTSEYAQLKKRVRSRQSPAVENNRALQRQAHRDAPLPDSVWELSHEHQHRDADGYFSDHTKFLGFFSSRAKARSAKTVLASKPGFRDTARGFVLARQAIDVARWEDGFAVYRYGTDDRAIGILPYWARHLSEATS